MERYELFEDFMTTKFKNSVEKFVSIYVDTVLDLAGGEYPNCEFYHRLDGRVSLETGLSLDATRYIGQVLSNFSPLKERPFIQNGKINWLGSKSSKTLWGSTCIVLGNAPSEEEKTKEINSFLDFYGKELLNRARSVYRDQENLSSIFLL